VRRSQGKSAVVSSGIGGVTVARWMVGGKATGLGETSIRGEGRS